MKLKRRNWSRTNHDSLGRLLEGVRAGELAVFDWDNTCIFNDIGEALLRRLAFGLEFRMDAAAMAASVPDRIHGIARIRLGGRDHSLKTMKQAVFSAYERLRHGPAAGGGARSGEDYRVFTSGLLALNRALEETPGIGCEFAYPWAVSLLQGLAPAELDAIAVSVIDRELQEPIRRHAVHDPLGRWRYGWTGGIRLYPEMKELAACWQERGGRVVVSTASCRRLVERMIATTAFPCREVIGMELAMAGCRFGRVLKPGLRPNIGAGKVANIRSRLGGEPALVAGDSDNDFEMLTSFRATRLCLVIDRRQPGRIALARRRARAGEKAYLAQEIDQKQGQFKAAPRRA